VLYLAEVQKQKGGLLSGGGKTELKLLACQRTDQNWSTVSEEVIAAEDASKLNDGALVLVELNPNRQVQRIQEAGGDVHSSTFCRIFPASWRNLSSRKMKSISGNSH
jgi:hypothetical protein